MTLDIIQQNIREYQQQQQTLEQQVREIDQRRADATTAILQLQGAIGALEHLVSIFPVTQVPDAPIVPIRPSIGE